jgi:hypothetical protein
MKSAKLRDSPLTALYDRCLTFNLDDMFGVGNLVLVLFAVMALEELINTMLNRGSYTSFQSIGCILADVSVGIAMIVAMMTFAFTEILITRINNQSLGMFLHATVVVTIIIAPVVAIFNYNLSPLGSTHVAITQIVLIMKLHSYRFVNELSQNGEGNWNDFFMYLMFPTLVYQKDFPRTESIRWDFVARNFALSAITLASAHVVFIHTAVPIIQSESHGLMEFIHDAVRIVVPSMVIWLLLFVSIIHCAFNGLAEITRFGDREFYNNFWNTHRLDGFWRRWNSLIYEWMLRYVYLQRVKNGTSRYAAIFMVFLFSAAWHEFLFFVIFHKIRMYFFAMMLIQAPLIMINDWLVSQFQSDEKKRFVGNVFVWGTLCIGHSLIELCYIRDWLQEERNMFCVDHTKQFTWSGLL